MHGTESPDFACDDDWDEASGEAQGEQHPGMKPKENSTLIKIEATSPCVYCEIRHTSPITYKVYNGSFRARCEEWTKKQAQ